MLKGFNELKETEIEKLIYYLDNNVEFYHKFLSEFDERERTSEIFNKLPIIDKKQIFNNYKQFVCKSIENQVIEKLANGRYLFDKDCSIESNGKKMWIESTTGSTGMPFSTIKSEAERIILGRNIWKLRNYISPIRTNEFFAYMHNRNGGYPFPFREEVNSEYRKKREIEYLKNEEYKWWHLYPKQLDGLCSLVSRNNVVFESLEVVECNGAFFSKEEKKRWEKIFGCKVVNNYGCREIWTIAYSCKYGELHINDKSVFVELVDDNNNIISEDGVIGNIIVTSKILKSLPYIRYKVGDKGYFVKGVCKCGKKEKRIVIVPDRSMILGTNTNGNIIFRSVINNVVIKGNVHEFDSINVYQENKNEFFIYVKGNCEQKEKLEHEFIKWSNWFLEDENNKYIFYYNSDKEFKSIFTANMKGKKL